jgi:hypothetical protein
LPLLVLAVLNSDILQPNCEEEEEEEQEKKAKPSCSVFF